MVQEQEHRGKMEEWNRSTSTNTLALSQASTVPLGVPITSGKEKAKGLGEMQEKKGPRSALEAEKT